MNSAAQAATSNGNIGHSPQKFGRKQESTIRRNGSSYSWNSCTKLPFSYLLNRRAFLLNAKFKIHVKCGNVGLMEPAYVISDVIDTDNTETSRH